jgi:hypothetical protein
MPKKMGDPGIASRRMVTFAIFAPTITFWPGSCLVQLRTQHVVGDLRAAPRQTGGAEQPELRRPSPRVCPWLEPGQQPVDRLHGGRKVIAIVPSILTDGERYSRHRPMWRNDLAVR